MHYWFKIKHNDINSAKQTLDRLITNLCTVSTNVGGDTDINGYSLQT